MSTKGCSGTSPSAFSSTRSVLAAMLPGQQRVILRAINKNNCLAVSTDFHRCQRIRPDSSCPCEAHAKLRCVADICLTRDAARNYNSHMNAVSTRLLQFRPSPQTWMPVFLARRCPRVPVLSTFSSDGAYDIGEAITAVAVYEITSIQKSVTPIMVGVFLRNLR
jgi:hypothetical protein